MRQQLSFDFDDESRYSKRKLTPAWVKTIKKALRCGMSQKALAKHFGVTKGTISHIKTGRIWQEVMED